MRFLVDAQLPPALARWLQAQGHEAEHVSDLGMMDASDHSIWQRAVETGAVIVTKDEDFADWHNVTTRTGPAIVWLRIGNTRKTELLRWMASALKPVVEALDRGETLIEVDHQHASDTPK